MRAQFTKHGPKHDYRGAHVTLEHDGRTLLGQIIDVYRRELPPACMAKVRYLCGDPWPFDPALIALDILERE